MQKLTLIFIFLFALIFAAQAQSTWQELDSIGNAFVKTQKFAEADSVFNEALVLIEQEVGKQDTLYANMLDQLLTSAYYQGRYDQAIDYAKQTVEIRKKVLGKEHHDYATACSNLGLLYKTQGLYDKAKPLYTEAKEIYEKVFGREHREYANTCSNLGLLYKSQGLYEKAEPLLVEAKEIDEKVFGKQHPEYATSCNNLGYLYKSQGLYDKAELLYIEAKDIYEKTFGKQHFYYANFCDNLALLYNNQGLYAKAEPLYKEAKEIYEKILGKQHPEYAASCNNLALLYNNQGLYAKAEPLYKEAKDIYEKVLGKQHLYYTISCNNLGVLYQQQGLYAQAESLFMEAKKTLKKVLGEQHPQYASSSNNLALLYKNQGFYAQAEPLYREAIGNKTVQISNLLPTLSEKERIAYLKSIEYFFSDFQDFALAYHPENPKITAELYNQNLFTKSLVFASTQKMRRQILNSGDSVLIFNFQNWKSKKDTYNKLLQKSKDEQEKSGVNLTQMASDINELEKTLSKRSTLFAENTTVQNYKWQQVREKLGKKEAVVEIIRTLRTTGYDTLGKNIKDTVYVALFVTDKTKKQPEMLVLENGSELETKYLNYYKRAIEFKIEDQNSYNQYWKPIQNKLEELRKKGFDKIYFSPDGVYHQISLNSLRNPETGEYLLESQNIQLIGTSRDLIELGNNETDLSQNFENYRTYLFGYPSYNLEGEGTESEGEDRGFSSLQRIVGQRGAVALLPGTKTEIEAIKGYFNQKNIKTQVLLEADANEQIFKNIKSPTILHVATHGFFVPKIKQSEVANMQDAVNRTLLENPFMRSGLLLAGCETPNPEGEDGVLTAEEAMNLSLENTELVVLSACETGLGDIQNGEGVFGLQRAFQQAGAKTVLMSLWKVSDEATQMLMSEFYKNLLSGKSKREAFKAAQLSLKAKFPEPYFWGAFVMIGE
ncbi:MAG: CHAT domain-containing protein [Bernardetiaceae bacterium]|nr:CHAT domain-containing protein [Bernardetiaceae bacterium]